MFVDIDFHKAKIKSVSGGRVLVDFNHPLAGRKLHYKLKVVRHITGTADKAESLLDYYKLEAKPAVSGEKLVLETENPVEKRVQEAMTNILKEWSEHD